MTAELKEYTNIDDDILINNFYEILKNEYGFIEIFKNIGISPQPNLNSDEIKKIKTYLKNNSGIDLKIELIRQLEVFRDTGKELTKFEDQIKSVIKLYRLIIDIFSNNYLTEYDLKFLDYDENLNYLKRSQDFSFQLKKFKRDNLIHQLRVFLLGCYIINSDKKFWIDRTWSSVLKDLDNVGKGNFRILLKIIYYNLSKIRLSKEDFILKSVFFTWMLSSLFHDIGRSIEDANEAIKTMTKTYRDLPYFRWSYLKSSNGTKIIHNLCPTCLIIKPDDIGEEKKKALFKFLELLPTSKHKYIKKIVEAEFNNLDHGVISAILCTDSNYLKEYESTTPVWIFKHPFRYFFYLLIHYSFISISLHNNQRYFFLSPLTQLLVAVDTLQEWERVTMIGDINMKIYPCHEIKLKFSEFNINGSKCKIIEAIVPYREPENECMKGIFKRRTPKYEEFIKELAQSKSDEKTFHKFYDKGVELRIEYKEPEKIFKMKICGLCGDIISHPSDLSCCNTECDNYGRV